MPSVQNAQPDTASPTGLKRALTTRLLYFFILGDGPFDRVPGERRLTAERRATSLDMCWMY